MPTARRGHDLKPHAHAEPWAWHPYSGCRPATARRTGRIPHDTHLLSLAPRSAAVVREAPRHGPGTLGRLLQEGFRPAEHHLARVGGRGPLRRLDRRHPQEPG